MSAVFLNKEMEQLLEQIVENTKPKTGICFVVSGKNSNIITRFNPSLELAEKSNYEIALINLETYYSFPNITAKNNIFRYSIDNGKNWNDIIIRAGSYELNQINTEILRQMEVNKHLDRYTTIVKKPFLYHYWSKYLYP